MINGEAMLKNASYLPQYTWIHSRLFAFKPSPLHVRHRELYLIYSGLWVLGNASTNASEGSPQRRDQAEYSIASNQNGGPHATLHYIL